MFFIARRYLLSKKSHSVVNIICCVSLVALLLPVAAVVILLSIFNGFGALVADLDSASHADITIRPVEGKFFAVSQLDSAALEGLEGVEGVSFVAEQMMLLRSEDGERVVTVRGVDSNYCSVVPIAEHVTYGHWGVALGDLESVVVGRSVASELGLRTLNISDVELVALRTGVFQSYLPSGAHTTLRADVSGYLELDEVSESQYVYTSLRAVNRLLRRDSVASKAVVKVSSQHYGGSSARAQGAVQRRVQGVVGDRFEVLTRGELNPAIYQIIRYEKYGIVLICSLVMVIAAFSLLGAITMLILEKRGDITTLRAMGATERMVRRLFLLEGLIIGWGGITFGVLLGVGLSLAQEFFGIIELPTTSTLLRSYPVSLQVGDVVAVVVISCSITYLLSYGTVRRVFRFVTLI